MAKEQIVLSLDQSTTATGWGLFRQGKLEGHGVYKPSGDRNERIDKTRIWVQEKIKELAKEENIDLHLILEDIQMQRNVETFKSLAHLQGVLVNVGFQTLKTKEISQMAIYYSSAWKSTCRVGGKKRAEQKANAHKHVLKKYGIDAPEDACDAICLGEHHLHQMNSVLNFE